MTTHDHPTPDRNASAGGAADHARLAASVIRAAHAPQTPHDVHAVPDADDRDRMRRFLQSIVELEAGSGPGSPSVLDNDNDSPIEDEETRMPSAITTNPSTGRRARVSRLLIASIVGESLVAAGVLVVLALAWADWSNHTNVPADPHAAGDPGDNGNTNRANAPDQPVPPGVVIPPAMPIDDNDPGELTLAAALGRVMAAEDPEAFVTHLGPVPLARYRQNLTPRAFDAWLRHR
ncbi:MAG: hypothetical protein AB7S36_18295, partial [Planctomycetota bacterium]